MAKKTQKRQSAIVSLSDRNAFEIQKTNDQKMQMLKDYEAKKSGKINDILLQRVTVYVQNCVPIACIYGIL